jgi:site-specific recombinase XerD
MLASWLFDQKMNEYLKLIADLCDRQKINLHIARHTFATSIPSNSVAH